MSADGAAPAGVLTPAPARLRPYASWSPVLSPDGGSVAFVSDRDGVPGVWTSRVGEDGASRLVSTSDPVTAVGWSPDGTWLCCLIAPRGGECTEVWAVRPDGTGLRRVAGGGGGSAFFGAWAREGAVLGLTEVFEPAPAAGGGPGGKGRALIVLVDLATDARHELAVDGLSRVCDVDLAGRRVLLRGGGRGRRKLVVQGLDDGKVYCVLPAADGDPYAGCFSADGHAVYLRSDAGREFAALLAVHLTPDGGAAGTEALTVEALMPETLKAEVLAARPDQEIETFALSGDRRTVALVWNAHGRSELVVMDLTTGRTRGAPVIPYEVVERVALSGGGERAVVAAEAPGAPAALWWFDLPEPSGTAVRRGSPPAARGPFDTLAVRSGSSRHGPVSSVRTAAAPELVRLRAHDGLEFTAWLHRPDPEAAAKRRACVISLHGGPEAQERPGFNPLYEVLLGAGIAVFAPNVRGSSGFGRSFVEADVRERRFDAIRDVATCADHILAMGLAERGRVGCMGRSYGGYLTLAALVEFPDLLSVGVDVCGISDFRTFFARTEPWIAAAAVSKYGDPDRDGDLLRKLSPMDRIDRLAAPLLVVHGARDTNVPVSESEQLVEAARARGLPVRYLVFDDEGHDFLRTANRDTLADAVLDWLGMYLPL